METLKISDLSVGDWVLMNGEPAKALRLTMAGRTIFKGLSGQIYGSIGGDIFPLPIVPEILEKNGFERLLERDLFYLSEAGLEVAFEDGEWMHTINLHEYTIHTISGVHHIQHLLRLYGCEKEINL